VLYTRQGCHLCEVAREQLEAAARDSPMTIEVRDVDEDEHLRAEYGLCVPVVEINGKVRFRGIVNPVLLRRVLRAESEPEA
jgi:hypothetical protein